MHPFNNNDLNNFSGAIYWGDGNTWYKEIFDSDGYHQETKNYNLSQLLIDEVRYKVDLNKDNDIGDTVDLICSNQLSSNAVNTVAIAGLYKTVSGGDCF